MNSERLIISARHIRSHATSSGYGAFPVTRILLKLGPNPIRSVDAWKPEFLFE